MYEGNPVDLQMEKVISADGIFDDVRQTRAGYISIISRTNTFILN